ncbi:MAG: response regulator transcription factor [Chitinophagales bacterium]
MPIKILIAETQYLIIEGLKSLFKRYPEIQVIGDTATKEDLFATLHTKSPDVILIDPLSLNNFRFDDISTIETVCPGTRILIITDIQNTDSVHKIVSTGVKGFLTKTCDEKEIVDSIYALMRGEKMFCYKVVNIIMNKGDVTENCKPALLSEREIEIIRLIANGYTTRQIADTLYRSFHTITTHRKNIMKKLDINSSSELLVYAMNNGLIQPREQLVTGR